MGESALAVGVISTNSGRRRARRTPLFQGTRCRTLRPEFFARPVPVPDSNFSVACDTAVLALGYWPDPIISKTTPELDTHDWGLVTVTDKETGATSRPGVYSAGDCVTGPDLVVTAMVGGRKAGFAIDEYLRRRP